MPLCVGPWAGTSKLTTMSGFFLSIWKAVTDSLLFLLSLKAYVSFSVSRLVARTRYGVDLNLNLNHALDSVDQAHNYARLDWHKGMSVCLVQHTVDLEIALSNSAVQRLGLVWAAGDWAIEWMYRWIRCVELRNSAVAHRPARTEDPVVGPKCDGLVCFSLLLALNFVVVDENNRSAPVVRRRVFSDCKKAVIWQLHAVTP